MDGNVRNEVVAAVDGVVVRVGHRLSRYLLFASGDEEGVVQSEKWNGDVHENGAADLQEELVLSHQHRSAQLRNGISSEDSSEIRHYLQNCYRGGISLLSGLFRFQL